MYVCMCVLYLNLVYASLGAPHNQGLAHRTSREDGAPWAQSLKVALSIQLSIPGTGYPVVSTSSAYQYKTVEPKSCAPFGARFISVKDESGASISSYK